MSIRSLLRRTLRLVGYDLVRYPAPPAGDLQDADIAVLRSIAGFTMTDMERQIALIHAVRYIVRQSIPGALVECGVWRGGSSMAAALVLQQEKEVERDLFLYDTFAGMTNPGDIDRDLFGTRAADHPDRSDSWCHAELADVRANMLSTGYPPARIHLIKGDVEETLPAHSPPGPVALLRLDTDWYASTRHELTHLFPRLSDGGVLIIDDYGHWEGARAAVDEYFATRKYFLHRIDYSGRLLIKRS